METKNFTVKGMSCEHCIKAVQKELAKLNLMKFEVSIGNVQAVISETQSTQRDIENAIREAGYEVTAVS